MASTTDPVKRQKYRVDYKVRCALTNKCKWCPKQNDNPTSLICRDCTRKQRMYRVQRQQAGKCIQCHRMQDPSSTQLCTTHLVAARQRARALRAA